MVYLQSHAEEAQSPWSNGQTAKTSCAQPSKRRPNSHLALKLHDLAPLLIELCAGESKVTSDLHDLVSDVSATDGGTLRPGHSAFDVETGLAFGVRASLGILAVYQQSNPQTLIHRVSSVKSSNPDSHLRAFCFNRSFSALSCRLSSVMAYLEVWD